MKHPTTVFVLIFSCFFIILAACNFSSSAPPAFATGFASTTSTGPKPASTPTVPPAPPPAPTRSRLQGGSYSCLECISEKFLEDYKVIGGVPPLTWYSNHLSLVVERDGSVSRGTGYFWIGTNSEGGEVCTNGEYTFDQDTTTGQYNAADNILTVEMIGVENYASDTAGYLCGGAEVSGPRTLELIFVVNEQGNLVLCKTGEAGDACLNNPMAILVNPNN